MSNPGFATLRTAGWYSCKILYSVGEVIELVSGLRILRAIGQEILEHRGLQVPIFLTEQSFPATLLSFLILLGLKLAEFRGHLKLSTFEASAAKLKRIQRIKSNQVLGPICPFRKPNQAASYDAVIHAASNELKNETAFSRPPCFAEENEGRSSCERLPLPLDVEPQHDASDEKSDGSLESREKPEPPASAKTTEQVLSPSSSPRFPRNNSMDEAEYVVLKTLYPELSEKKEKLRQGNKNSIANASRAINLARFFNPSHSSIVDRFGLLGIYNSIVDEKVRNNRIAWGTARRCKSLRRERGNSNHETDEVAGHAEVVERCSDQY